MRRVTAAMVSGSAHRRGTAQLIAVTVVWGTTFPLVKNLGAHLTPPSIVAGRFTIAAVVLIPWLKGLDRTRLLHGIQLGAMLFASFASQTIGLRHVSAGRAAFITGLNVIMVPLAFPLIGRRLPVAVFPSAALAVAGIALLSWDDGALRFSGADAWVVLCALTYASYVLMLERYSHRHQPLSLTAVQVTTVSACGLAWFALDGRTAAVDAMRHASAGTWITLLYLGVVAVAVTTLLQTSAQRFVSAAIAAVVYSLEPVFGAIASFLWRGERIRALGYVGAAMIVAAMIVSQLGETEPSGEPPEHPPLQP